MKKIIIATVILFSFSCMSVHAQVTKLILSLDSTTNSGKCPQTLKFKLEMQCSSSGSGSIVWRKSDGTFQTVNSAAFKAGSNYYYFDWKITSVFTGSLSVLVNTSNHKESNTVNFNVTCK